MGQIPKDCATRAHPKPPRPHLPLHPMGRFPHPETHVGEAHLWLRTHRWAYRTLMMGGQNGCSAVNLRRTGANTRNCATRGHPTHPPRPHPHPTPWGGSPTPRRTLGRRIYGLGTANGPIGPWGWVAKMGVLQKSLSGYDVGHLGAG
jgi:hypothetical protein